MMKQTSHSSRQETELMNIETAHHHEEDKMRVLYEASYKGCVSTLNSLLQEYPGMLQKISSQTIFIETPLHISASHGHLEFTETLLSHKPELALERNALRSTPLHLASAEGHMDIVKKLLEAREEVCLFRDQEARIPLHYAVIRGRRDVVLEIIIKKPESLKIHDGTGKTIFHLCVMYNQLELVKDLVMKLNTHDTHELLIERDIDGKNTVLHLAIMFKQVETVSYLISIPKIRSNASNLKNGMGYSAADIVDQIPKDSKSLEIQIILMEHGIKCGRKERIDAASEEDRSGKKWSWSNVFKRIDQWLVYNGDWVEDMRGNLSLVATAISTMTFQSVLNPPGNVIQQNIRSNDSNNSNITSVQNGPLGCLPYKDESGHRNGSAGLCPGQAVLAYRDKKYFETFLVYNTISFVASMCLVLLLVSGIPLKHRLVMWVLSITMNITVACLLAAYTVGLILITPYDEDIDRLVFRSTWIFVALLALVAIYIVTMFVRWAAKKLKAKLSKHRESNDYAANA